MRNSGLIKFIIHPLKSGGRPRTSMRLSEGGWTLIELMLVMAMIAIITPAMTYLFAKVTQGMASDEMHTQLQLGNQALLNRIQVRMAANRHFFMADTSGGVSFLTRLNLSTAPSTLAGTTLSQPQTSTTGSLSPNVSGFQPTFVGNALLFGAYDAPQTIFYNTAGTAPKIATAVPMTVTGASVTDMNGEQQTIIVDLYRFYFYYLTSQVTKQLYDTTAYSLIEWQSVQFPDWTEIVNYNDSVLQGNILAMLKASGLTTAWDPTQTDPSQAFVTFGGASYGTASTGVTGVNGTYTIPMETYYNVTKVQPGILSTGFRYGISPNSANWKSAPVQVPLFATGAGAFPSGFEVAAGSNSSGRQVMLRSVWVAEGANGGKVRAVYNDINMVDEIADNW